MKPFITIMLLAASTSVLAQKLEPGVYTADAGTYPATIKVNGNTITYKDYRETITYTLESGNKYTTPGSKVHILVDGPEKFTRAEENSTWKAPFVMYSPENAKPGPGVIAFTVKDAKYYAKKYDGSDVVGTYKYKKMGNWGEPLVVLNADGTGSFQRHDVAPDPVEWWIETDPRGKIQKQLGEGNDNYRMLLVVRYKDDGTYQRMQLDVVPSQNKSIIMGERVYQR